MVYNILGNCMIVFMCYFWVRYCVVVSWERAGAKYIAAYRKAFPLDFRVSKRSFKVSWWLSLCPWKWYIRHCFEKRAWDALCEKFQIR